MNWAQSTIAKRVEPLLIWQGAAPAVHLQERDLFLLKLLCDHPYLSSTQLDALIKAEFPTVPSPNGKILWPTHATGLKRRRTLMFRAGYIARPGAWTHLRREAPTHMLHYLTDKGCQALQNATGEEVYWTRKKLDTATASTLAHQGFLNEFFSCLSLALKPTSSCIKHWLQDARIYAKVAVPDYEANGGISSTTSELRPDAFAILAHPDGRGQAVYVEADLSGGVRLNSQARAEKSMLTRYRRYWHLQRASKQPFVVLTFSPNAKRLQNLKALIRTQEPWYKQKTGMLWFAQASWDMANPGATLEAWTTAWDEPKHLLS